MKSIIDHIVEAEQKTGVDCSEIAIIINRKPAEWLKVVKTLKHEASGDIAYLCIYERAGNKS